MRIEDLTNNVHLMIGVMRLHRNMCEQLVGQLGVHQSQHRLLMNLSKKEEAPSQKELAGELGVSSAAVAVTIKKLERGGYITRRADDGDMRQNRIDITPLGREIIAKSQSIFCSVDKRMFNGFDDRELDAFHSYLLRIQSNMIGEEIHSK